MKNQKSPQNTQQTLALFLPLAPRSDLSPSKRKQNEGAALTPFLPPILLFSNHDEGEVTRRRLKRGGKRVMNRKVFHHSQRHLFLPLPLPLRARAPRCSLYVPLCSFRSIQ